MVGIIAAGLSAGYYYYTSTQTELAELRQLNAAYELKINTQDETIKYLKSDFETQTLSLKQLQISSQHIQQEMDRYLDIFRRHNLSKLAAAKPGLIETRANAATKEIFDGIEKDSTSIDSLDDGLQLTQATASGSEDNNKTSGTADSSTSTSTSN